MKHYEITNGRGTHVFNSYSSVEEVIQAISEWFNQLKEEIVTIECVKFDYCEDGTINAIVFWSYLTEAKKEELKEELRRALNKFYGLGNFGISTN